MESKKGQETGLLLPLSRFNQFFDLVRFRFIDIFLCSICSALFLIPSILWLLFCSLSGFVDPTNMYSILLVYGVLAILISLMGLGSAGTYYFYRKTIYGEGSSFQADFFTGIRKNYKEGLLSHFLIGVLYLLLKLDIGSLGALGLGDTWTPILLGLSYVLFYVLASLFLFYQPQYVLYEGGMGRLLMNSVRFYVGSFLKSLGITILYFLPFFLYELIGNVIGEWIIILIFALAYNGFASLANALYCTYLFDISINPRYYPDLVRKGLRKIDSNKM